jgi:hypothetical protein
VTTHGVVDKNGRVHSKSDIDGTSSITLLKYAGIVDNTQVNYVAPGEKREKTINIDTGKANGLKFENKNKNTLL